MKTFDLTTTGNERQEAAGKLVRTEETNAVNTGLVEKADKSASALRMGVHDKGRTRNPKNLAKGVAVSIAHDACSDSELEDIDDACLTVLDAKRMGSRILDNARLEEASGDVLDNNSLGNLLQKQYQAKKEDAQETQRNMQSRRNQYRSRAIAQAETAKATAGAKTAGATAAAEGGGGLASVLSGIGGGTVLAIVGVLLALVVVVVLVMAVLSQEDQNVGMLSGNEAEVATFLKAQGLDNLHVAAIMANMRAESGGEPGTDFDVGSIEAGSGAGHGLCQWTGGRWNGEGGLLEFANSQGKDWTDIGVQLEFFWVEYSANWAANYHIVNGNSTDPPAGTYVYGSKSAFEATGDLHEATTQFCYGWERPGIPHITTRLHFADQYFAMLESGGNQAVVDAAFQIAEHGTPYVYGGTDIYSGCDCSYFTQWCYAQAGISIPRTANSQKLAGTVIPISEAQAGDILWMNDHVGIYIDSSTVIEQTPSYCRVNSITYNRWECAVRIAG